MQKKLVGKNSVSRVELEKYVAEMLNVTQYRDYCPNGLQVEGRAEIFSIITGVTASQALLEAALEAGADAILVHHGYFWKGEDARVIGPKHNRLKLLLTHDINLFAYHLPLDAHPELGNNAQLAQELGLVAHGRFGDDNLGWLGTAADAAVQTVGDLARLAAARLRREPILIGDPDQPLGPIAWCTGAAQNYLGNAIAAGASVYISGEISEPTVHLARESGVAYIAAGHHATERYGVQALGRHLAEHFGLSHRFIDIDNPV
ncbi:Nif3-like dinuclear metal center hexameric protein [Glaciimonas immobilis]|uniref:Dinuclear metal center YbgI/SA1388 family protein n=1 Tax=Glaciimonas immobilis TaxID=728004 RepID=A0A840RSR9_9BURK|nr:Nif3-like dinuclear metal center hexameric protein [Glaciimonas immobilis]KAF3999747.1 Nif3-like dinuclear metal center hexameric protein [Glaciimonas immobilis]MBB5200202.1 dinuclear metal center YbgI/SA1388 family protein [Glaciimonas immobilis]